MKSKNAISQMTVDCWKSRSLNQDKIIDDLTARLEVTEALLVLEKAKLRLCELKVKNY